MNKTTAKRYAHVIKTSKIRHLTCEALSRHIGIYPEVIAENLSYFEPMLSMDPIFDLRDLLPRIEAYIAEQEASKPKEHRIVINSKELLPYKSVNDFVYQKMTINGLVSRNGKLSEEDLKILKKLIDKELQPAKGKKKRK